MDGLELQNLKLVIHEISAELNFRVRENRAQRLLDKAGLVAKRRDSDDRALPDILMLELGDRDVESLPQAILQAAKDLALILQRARLRKIDVEREKANWHKWAERFTREVS